MIYAHLLGGFSIHLSDREEVPAFPTQKAASLTAYLITHAGQAHSREFLAEMLWPNRPAVNARRSLITALWQIRSTLKKAGLDNEFLLKTTSTQISWIETEKLWLDTKELEKLIKADTITELKKAKSLYKGPFLPHFYDEWCLTERYRIESLFHSVLLKLIALQIQERQYEEAVANAQQVRIMDPLNEGAHQALIYCYYQQGDRSAAIEQYIECVRLLNEELGTHPSEKTQQLYENILEEKIPRLNPAENRSRRAADALALVPVTASPAPVNEVENIRANEGYYFIGREIELNTLLNWWEKPGELCILIKGITGSGKTRLAQELSHTLEAQGVFIGWGRGFSSAANVPYYALFHAIHTMLQQVPDAVRRQLPAQIIQDVSQFFPESLTEQNNTPISLDTKLDHGRFFNSVSKLITSVSQMQPVLIVYDDFQWATEPGVQLIEFIVRHLEANSRYLRHPVKFLFTCPSEMSLPSYGAKMLSRLQHDHLVTDLLLNNLSRESVLRWIQQWSGGDESISPFAEMLYRQLKGNPFLISEMVRGMFLSGRLSKGNAGWEGEALLATTQKLPIPSYLIKQVQGEVRDLSPHAKELLYAASVYGPVFNILFLKEMLNLEDTLLYRAVDELLQCQLVAEAETGQPYEFEFIHQLYQEAIYTQISATLRMRLHLKIAQRTEDEYGESAADRILCHYRKASDYANAAQWALRACKQAIAQSDISLANELLEQAEEYSEKNLVTEEIRRQIWEGLCELYIKTGNTEKAKLYSGRLLVKAKEGKGVKRQSKRLSNPN